MDKIYQILKGNNLNRNNKRTEFTKKLAGLKTQEFFKSEFEMLLPLTDIVLDSNGRSLTFVKDRLEIVSNPNQWSYMAYVPISFLLPIKRQVTMVVRAKVTEGIVGFGIFEKMKKIIFEKEVYSDPDYQDVILALSKLKKDCYLVIRTWARPEQTSKTIIENVRIINNESFSQALLL